MEHPKQATTSGMPISPLALVILMLIGAAGFFAIARKYFSARDTLFLAIVAVYTATAATTLLAIFEKVKLSDRWKGILITKVLVATVVFILSPSALNNLMGSNFQYFKARYVYIDDKDENSIAPIEDDVVTTFNSSSTVIHSEDVSLVIDGRSRVVGFIVSAKQLPISVSARFGSFDSTTITFDGAADSATIGLKRPKANSP